MGPQIAKHLHPPKTAPDAQRSTSTPTTAICHFPNRFKKSINPTYEFAGDRDSLVLERKPSLLFGPVKIESYMEILVSIAVVQQKDDRFEWKYKYITAQCVEGPEIGKIGIRADGVWTRGRSLKLFGLMGPRHVVQGHDIFPVQLDSYFSRQEYRVLTRGFMLDCSSLDIILEEVNTSQRPFVTSLVRSPE